MSTPTRTTTCSLYQNSDACTAALENPVSAQELSSYLNCVASTGLCSIEGRTVHCSARQLSYTYLLDPGKCASVRAAISCTAPASIASCSEPLEKTLAAFQCAPNAPQITLGLLLVALLALTIAAGCIAAAARAGRAAGSTDEGRLQRLDGVLRRWRNLLGRTWLLNRRRPWHMVFEQLTPTLLSCFLVVMVNLQPATQLQYSYPVSVFTLEVDFGEIELSSIASQFLERMESLFALFFVLCYCKFASSLTAQLVRDKETRTTEMLLVMGTSQSALHGCWLVSWLLTFLPLSLIMGFGLTLGGVFRNEDCAALSLFFLAFSFTMLCYAQVASPFFNKSKTASWVAPLAWLLLHLLSYRVTTMPTPLQGVFSLFPQVGFAIGVNRMAREGLFPSFLAALCSDSTVEAVLPSGLSLVMMVLEGLLMLGMAWYLRQVLPKEYGVALPWSFPFQRSYWRGEGVTQPSIAPNSKVGLAEELLEEGKAGLKETNSACVEDTGMAPADGIEVRGLRKEFTGHDGTITHAVQGLDVSFRLGEVSVMLGPNGAGKSTAIALLTGMLPASGGSVNYFGTHGLGDIAQLRQKMGLCPQHDVLLGELTVQESLKFFCTAKGVLPEQLQAEVETMLQQVGLLHEKIDAKVDTLSGGQKRKLSLAIALAGGSEIIILDEPTAGMDPTARRHVWDVVQRHKAGRVIILTTHFMDEAEALGDRVSIVADGALQCQGSPLWLKRRYCKHALLHALAGPECDIAVLQSVLRSKVPGCQVEGRPGGHLVLHVPEAEDVTLLALVAELEHRAVELGVCELAVSAPTLDDVFTSVVGAEKGCSAQASTAARVPAAGSSNARQFSALLRKRWHFASRDRSGLLLSVAMPLLFLGALVFMPPVDFVEMGIVETLTPKYEKLQASTNAFLGCIVVAMAMVFLPVSMATYVVKEHEPQSNVRLLQFVCGVRRLPYWASLFTFDCVTAVIPTIAAAVALCTYFSRCGVALSLMQIAAASTLLLLYTVGQIPVTYVLSQRFEHHSRAQTALLVWGLLSGPLLAICAEVLKFISSFPSTISLARLSQMAQWLYLVSPGFSLIDGLYNIAMQDYGAPIGYYGDGFSPEHASAIGSEVALAPYCAPTPSGGPWGGGLTDPSCWADPSVNGCCTPPTWGFYLCGRNMLYLGFEALVALCILRACSGTRSDAPRPTGDATTEECRVAISSGGSAEDSDVQVERQRVESGAAHGEVLQMRGLRKEYHNGKVALEAMSLGVAGECFGYLGENGAGKTTTIKMLIGDIRPSGGSAAIGGFDVVLDSVNSRKMLGYCPQFDALLENLTVREHLALFAELKGIPPAHCEGEASSLIDLMGLAVFGHTLAHQLSGGNKRKLCAAIALLGAPKLVIMDEPSTGMDPVARRSMWGVIRGVIASGCTVMLVTHLMEECEALCSRVGVLVGGRLRCLGSPQRLKSQFGKNEFHVQLKLPTSSNGASVSEGSTHQSDKDVAASISEFFKGRFEHVTVTEITKDFGVVEYSVGQTSLEQIFNSLVAENQMQSR